MRAIEISRPASVVECPRGQAGVDVLVRAEPRVVVLVDSDPDSFARVAELLAAAGLQLDRMTVVDLFPGTSHVETVGAFIPG